MRTVMTLNPKGGCGKSTLATNLASFFASAGNSVALADLDSQRSSLDWLSNYKGWALFTDCDMLVLDAPAAVHGRDLTALVKRAETIVIPVLPSPMDMRACARFITELLTVGKVSRQQTKLAVVANRVRETTVIYQSLEAFLRQLSIPFIATLRDSQNYIRAAERGLGIFELAPSLAANDLEHWKPLLRWLKSKRSRPDGCD